MGSQARSMANFWPTLITRLCARGHSVFCFVPKTNDEADKKAIATLKTLGAEVLEVPLERRGLNPFKDIYSLFHLWGAFRRVKPDVFFGYAIKPVIYGNLAAWLAKVPARLAMITGLGYTFEADSLPKRLLTNVAAFLYKTALSRCQTVFFQNQDDLATFKKYGIISPSPRQDFVQMVRGTGVDIERFANSPPVLEPPLFLLVGRLIEAKGVKEFAAAAQQLKCAYPDARFQILGPGESGVGSVSPLEVANWQEQGFIEYLGAVEDVRPYIAKASVMVLPSYREGLPCSILEGMSMGRPAVVANVPGCREVVVEGENGFLVQVKNAAALAAAMQKFIDDPTLIESMGDKSRAFAVQEFDARLVADGLIDIMEKQSQALGQA